MGILKRIESIPNIREYLKELSTAYHNGDEATMKQVFDELEQELKKIRNEASIKDERSKNQSNDLEVHFARVKREEIMDLTSEYEDRLELFKLAHMCNYEPMMEVQFSKMIQSLSDIRERRSIREERSKKMWKDPETHFYKVIAEENIDLQYEISDLLKLYEVAKSAKYTAGMILVSDQLSDIAHKLIKTTFSIYKTHK